MKTFKDLNDIPAATRGIAVDIRKQVITKVPAGHAVLLADLVKELELPDNIPANQRYNRVRNALTPMLKNHNGRAIVQVPAKK